MKNRVLLSVSKLWDSEKKGRIKRYSRIHFNRNTERTFFFVLTLAMLVMGFLAKMGI